MIAELIAQSWANLKRQRTRSFLTMLGTSIYAQETSMKSVDMEKIQQLVSEMTLEEKASLCSGRDAWSTKPIERLNVPWIWVADGPHGLRKAPEMPFFPK